MSMVLGMTYSTSFVTVRSEIYLLARSTADLAS
jgi:hypothetical protein